MDTTPTYRIRVATECDYPAVNELRFKAFDEAPYFDTVPREQLTCENTAGPGSRILIVEHEGRAVSTMQATLECSEEDAVKRLDVVLPTVIKDFPILVVQRAATLTEYRGARLLNPMRCKVLEAAVRDGVQASVLTSAAGTPNRGGLAKLGYVMEPAVWSGEAKWRACADSAIWSFHLTRDLFAESIRRIEEASADSIAACEWAGEQLSFR